MKGSKTSDHIKAVLQLPFMVLVVIPSLIYFFSKNNMIINLAQIMIQLRLIIGVFLLAVGSTLFVKSILLFIRIGNGTLAPWNPTKNMIISGLYQYMRNPMLVGVNLLLVSEAFLLPSGNILIWCIFFIVLNHLYFVFSEEPKLLKKFGREYSGYKKNVPRWIPRLKPWKPEVDDYKK